MNSTICEYIVYACCFINECEHRYFFFTLFPLFHFIFKFYSIFFQKGMEWQIIYDVYTNMIDAFLKWHICEIRRKIRPNINNGEEIEKKEIAREEVIGDE